MAGGRRGYFQGKNAVVVGATGGLGRAIAEALVDQGVGAMVLAARREGPLLALSQTLQERCRKAGGKPRQAEPQGHDAGPVKLSAATFGTDPREETVISPPERRQFPLAEGVPKTVAQLSEPNSNPNSNSGAPGEIKSQPLVRTLTVDLASAESISRFVERLFDTDSGSRIPDIIINATGCSDRKLLWELHVDEVQRMLTANLHGPMLLTREAMAPRRDFSGVLVHLGGFAGGRLAMPFYSVDVGTRAGLRSFLEAVNRELELEGRLAHTLFFSPDPADTESERPYLGLWRQLGSQAVSPQTVALEVLSAIERRRRLHVMGGLPAAALASLNSLCPEWADALLLKSWGPKLKSFFLE